MRSEEIKEKMVKKKLRKSKKAQKKTFVFFLCLYINFGES